MDIIGFVSEVIIAIVKHGWSATLVIAVIAAFLRYGPIKRILMRMLPKWLRKIDNRMDGMDLRISRMESKIDALMSAGGVKWDVDSLNGKTVPSATDGVKKNSCLSQVALWPVRIITLFTRKKKEIYHLSGRYQKMKSKFLSRKFLMALISAGLVIANDGLNLGLDSNTIIAFGSIVVGWIIGEAAVDVARKPQGGTDDGLYSSTKDSEGA